MKTLRDLEAAGLISPSQVKEHQFNLEYNELVSTVDKLAEKDPLVGQRFVAAEQYLARKLRRFRATGVVDKEIFLELLRPIAFKNEEYFLKTAGLDRVADAGPGKIREKAAEVTGLEDRLKDLGNRLRDAGQLKSSDEVRSRVKKLQQEKVSLSRRLKAAGEEYQVASSEWRGVTQAQERYASLTFGDVRARIDHRLKDLERAARENRQVRGRFSPLEGKFVSSIEQGPLRRDAKGRMDRLTLLSRRKILGEAKSRVAREGIRVDDFEPGERFRNAARAVRGVVYDAPAGAIGGFASRLVRASGILVKSPRQAVRQAPGGFLDAIVGGVKGAGSVIGGFSRGALLLTIGFLGVGFFYFGPAIVFAFLGLVEGVAFSFLNFVIFFPLNSILSTLFQLFFAMVNLVIITPLNLMVGVTVGIVDSAFQSIGFTPTVRHPVIALEAGTSVPQISYYAVVFGPDAIPIPATVNVDGSFTVDPVTGARALRFVTESAPGLPILPNAVVYAKSTTGDDLKFIGSMLDPLAYVRALEGPRLSLLDILSCKFNSFASSGTLTEQECLTKITSVPA